MSTAGIHIMEINDKISMDILHPVLRKWVCKIFGSINILQNTTIPRIIDHKNTLIMAPTGSGKTLSVFLGILSVLQKMDDMEELEDHVYALYVSPLKALNNDIHKNLDLPLQALQEAINSNIRIGKRTGDTTTNERAKMLRKPPHILITTPESLGLMQTSPKFKLHLRNIEWIIIDEIHAIAGNKRGILQALNVERVCYYLNKEPCRIGISATIEPQIEIANYLRGNRKTEVGIINIPASKKMDLKVISPVEDLILTPYSKIEDAQIEILQKIIEENTTSLIFTNTRSLAEKLSYKISEIFDEWEKIAVHHGSLDKNVRLSIEEKLKHGDMLAVFSSTSLEMGIDIGSIDIVAQIGSPKTVRSLLQRVGRSGHSLAKLSRGRLIITTRDDLIECTSMGRMALKNIIDRITIPEAPADVLFQTIVGMALEQKWTFKDAYEIIHSAYPYRNLSFDEFVNYIKWESNPTEEGWKYTHIWMDEKTREFGKRRSSRQAYMQNIGTIPELSMISVILQGYRTRIGQVSEKFAEKLEVGDIFLLGGHTYEMVRSVGNKLIVKEVFGVVPTVPSWVGEGLSRSKEVSYAIDELFQKVEPMIILNKREEVFSFLSENYPVEAGEINALYEYIYQQIQISKLPLLNRIVIEKYVDPGDHINYLFLSIYGQAVNLALAHIIATQIAIRIDTNVATVATDNGFLIKLPPGMEFDVRSLFEYIKTDTWIVDAENKIRQTELFKHRFRHAANRSLMILRRRGQIRNSMDIQQKQVKWLLQILDPKHPIILETVREILHDVYDTKTAIEVLNNINKGIIKLDFILKDNPSPMTHQIILNGELDILEIKDRKSLLQSLHNELLSQILPETDDIIFNLEDVNKYFRMKTHKEFIDIKNAIHAISSLAIQDFYKYAAKLTGYNKSELIDNASHITDIVVLDDRLITIELLAHYAAIHNQEFWKGIHNNNNQIIQAKELYKNISPMQGLEYIIINILRYIGPLNVNELVELTNIDKERLETALFTLLRKQDVYSGKFTHKEKQYILAEDRDGIIKQFRDRNEITQEQLLAYRTKKMNLVEQLRDMSLEELLLKNGPARDAVELFARLPDFSWKELRSLLLKRKVYFGRFMGGRLMFMHEQFIRDFITVARTDKLQGDEFELYLTIADIPGITKSQIIKITGWDSSRVQNAITILEKQLYISRIGWSLSLTLGGFTNPQYIVLPDGYSRKEESIFKIIQYCIDWYGPLNLKDIIRITRFDYETVESFIEKMDFETHELFGYLYYGKHSDFVEIKSSKQKDTIHILSPLDPFFYMTSGSLRASSFPRQTRLFIVINGHTHGHIDIKLPNRDILQVLNVYIGRKWKTVDIAEFIGNKLLQLAKNTYLCQMVTIEEINNVGINDTENSQLVIGFKKASYTINIDQLVAGVHKYSNISEQDIIEIRLLNERKIKYKSFTELIAELGIISTDEVFNYLDMKRENAKIEISNALRNDRAINYNGNLYSPYLWFSENTKMDNELETLIGQKEFTYREIKKISGKDDEWLIQKLKLALQNKLIHIITPYAKILEYKRIPQFKYDRYDKLDSFLQYIINKYGPITFGEIIEEFNKIIKVSRIELLLLITEKIKSGNVLSILSKNGKILYLNKYQIEVARDNTRKHKFDKYSISTKLPELYNKYSKYNYILLNYGKPIMGIITTNKVDTILMDIDVLEEEELDDKELINIIATIEKYVLDMGRIMHIRKLNSFEINYWINLISDN